MQARARRTAFVLSVLAAVVPTVAAVRSPSLRASVRAAYLAFRDPKLITPTTLPAPAAVSCAKLADDAKQLDADLSHSLDRPLPEDLDDPEGATIASLTLPDIHVPITRRTMRFVRFLAKTDAGRKAFLQRHRRAGIYRESIAFALREAGLPEDLLWLAAVESGFDPRAVSPAGAAGLWQFMPDTAQIYGLEQSSWIDERRSIVRSTHAAVTHLRDLYERFGRWDLALAAYNAGFDRVVSAMERVRASRAPERLDDRPLTFSDLAAARALPEETINYVPQIMAFALVAANASRFGLDGAELGAPLDIGEIAVPEGTRLRTIARAAGVSISVLRDYNPQLLRDRVPPIGGDYLVALPEARVQRALASFPSYSDEEVVAQNDGDGDGDGDRDDVVRPMAEPSDTATDDPLPRRPVPLGKNRLPAMPGQERVLASAPSFGIMMLDAKLPLSLAMPDVGWRRVVAEDPLGLFGARGGVIGAKAHDAAIEKHLGFLQEATPAVEALRSFALPNGITVRVRREKGAPTTSITVRVATIEDPGEGAAAPIRLARRGAEVEASEALHTITVQRADSDAGIELAATRLRVALGDTSAAELAEIRFRAGNARRSVLQSTPYGQSWLALGETLFPADHPLAGTVLGSGEDGHALRDMMIAEVMRREHTRAHASLTIIGDVDEVRAKKLAEAFLAPVGAPIEGSVVQHPREDRITVEDDVTSPRALVAWVGPGEAELGDASLRVAIEMLENPKIGLLNRVLVATGMASMASAGLEVWPRASVAAIEVAPAGSHDVREVIAALDAEIAKLGIEGPDANQVALAKWFVHARLQKDLAAASAETATGAVHSASLAKLRHALRPWAIERTSKLLDEVTPSSVGMAVRRVLAKDHRVVVTTIPRVNCAGSARAGSGAACGPIVK